jgi:hypothetical protein
LFACASQYPVIRRILRWKTKSSSFDREYCGKGGVLSGQFTDAKTIAVMGCLALSASALYFPFTLTRDSELGTRPHNLHDDAVYTGDNVELFFLPACLSVTWTAGEKALWMQQVKQEQGSREPSALGRCSEAHKAVAE